MDRSQHDHGGHRIQNIIVLGAVLTCGSLSGLKSTLDGVVFHRFAVEIKDLRKEFGWCLDVGSLFKVLNSLAGLHHLPSHQLSAFSMALRESIEHHIVSQNVLGGLGERLPVNLGLGETCLEKVSGLYGKNTGFLYGLEFLASPPPYRITRLVSIAGGLILLSLLYPTLGEWFWKGSWCKMDLSVR